MRVKTELDKSIILDRLMYRELRRLKEDCPTWGQCAVSNFHNEQKLFLDAITKIRELRAIFKQFPSQEEATKFYNEVIFKDRKNEIH